MFIVWYFYLKKVLNIAEGCGENVLLEVHLIFTFIITDINLSK